MPNLDAELRELTAGFAAELVLAVKRAALEEVARVMKEVEAQAPEVAPPAPRSKRTAVRGGTISERILDFVRRHPGERSETVRAGLGISRAHMQSAVKKLVQNGQLTSKGERRATRYFVR